MRHVLALAFIACSSTPPPPPTVIKTATMAATITVTGDGTTTVAEAVLLSGDTLMDHFSLGMGDSLTASKGMPVPMMASGTGAMLKYDASFPGMDMDGTTYTIAFTRTVDGGAPKSTAVMPMPLTISMPTDGMSLSRGMNDISVTYAPSGSMDPITWSIEGPCVRATGMQPVIGDSGSFIIARGGLKDAGPGGTCMATLTVYRTRPGTLDPAFVKGGKVTAIQLGKVSISTKP